MKTSDNRIRFLLFENCDVDCIIKEKKKYEKMQDFQSVNFLVSVERPSLHRCGVEVGERIRLGGRDLASGSNLKAPARQEQPPQPGLVCCHINELPRVRSGEMSLGDEWARSGC